jgi:hypothetical protein
MVQNFIFEKDGKERNLSASDTEYFAGYVPQLWDKFDSMRSACLQANESLAKVISPCMTSNNEIKMPQIYELRESYKAHLWKSLYSSVESMFDVQGRSLIDQKNASKQKAALSDIFKKINLPLKIEAGLDNWIDKGEFIAFISWSKKLGRFRRKGVAQNMSDASSIQFDRLGNNKDILNTEVKNGKSAIANDKMQRQNSFVVVDEVVYDGPDITIISPEAFVFDPSGKQKFASCPKIYRSWATFAEIAKNPIYSDFEGLEILIEENSNSFAQAENKAVNGKNLEILEFWGDISLPDGTVLENYVATVAGRSKLIRFEPNPYIINPFVFASFIEEPASKRGISPLYVAMPLNNISTTILNLQIEALKLIINKPYLAPKGSLCGNIKIKEGAIIEYDPSLMPKEPIPLDFKDALVGWDFLKFFETKIESSTGIYKQMTGNPAVTAQRTATEAGGIMLSQNIRLSKEVDLLNLKVKLPIIKKIASLSANFDFEPVEVKIHSPSGDVNFEIIDESIRQGNYDYVVNDGVAVFEKRSRTKQTLEMVYQFASRPEIAPKIKWVELMKWAFDQVGSVDPSMFIASEEELKG